jgi:putative heme-binding domain-containing protein
MTRERRFNDALGRLLSDDALQPAAIRAIGRLRVDALAADVLALVKSDTAAPAARAAAVRVTARLNPPGAADALRGLLDGPDRVVARAALDGLVELQDIRALREILAGDRFSSDVRRSAARQLVDSTGGALVLLRMIDEGQLSPELTEQVVSKAASHADANVRVLYEKFVPEDQRPKKLGKSVTADEILALSGDANRGRVIFFKSSAAQCKACHAVHGFGASTGPELTNIGKKYERRALLETILDPSKAIAPEFVPYLLETTGGQVLAGFLVERTGEQVLLKDIKGEQIRVPIAEVEALVQQKKSLMPELVLSEVTAQDAADLLEFLTSLK